MGNKLKLKISNHRGSNFIFLLANQNIDKRKKKAFIKIAL